ncbi:MAG: magnesium transporter [Pseudomonadota bacterium]
MPVPPEDTHASSSLVSADAEMGIDDDGDENEYLRDSDIHDILTALSDEDMHKVEILLGELSPGEVAEVLTKVTQDTRTYLVDNYADSFAPEVFLYLNDDIRADVLGELAPRRVAQIITDLESDDALDLILPLPVEQRQKIIHYLSTKTRLNLEQGLSYPDSSAGRLMQREFVAVPQFWTVGKTLDYFRASATADELPDEFFDIILIDPSYHVIGEVPLYELVQAKRSTKLEDLKIAEVATIPATMDQEEVAYIFRREGIKSAPVVDDDERLVGVVTIDDILDVIDEEAGEDILKLGGVGKDDLHRAVLRTTQARFKWLFINLITAILASVVVSQFEATIQQIVALAVLMPIVASMGGNAGTQSLTIAVRALATKELSTTNMMRVIGKETLVGMVNGMLFAIIAGVLAGLWFSSPGLGMVIAIAMIINLVFAGFFGAVIPIAIQRSGGDPAISSSIVLTTITDIVGFFAFLGLAALILI